MTGDLRTRARTLGALAAASALGCSVAPAVAHASSPRAARAHALHATIALRPRDPVALAAYAHAVSTPGSRLYGHYLTPRQFGRRFGAPAARIRAVTASLRAHGLHPGAPSAGGLSIPLTASGGRSALRAALATRSLGAGVQSVIGLHPAARARPLAVRASPAAVAGAREGHATTTPHPTTAATTAGPHPCAAAAAAAPAQSAYTDDQIASAYGFAPLYAAGDVGAGTTVAVYELEPNDPADIAAFQSCYGTHAAISYVHVDGGAGSGAGSDEAAFDIENLIGFAPGVRVLVYQGPNSNSGAPGSGPYDTFSAIINQNRARVVTVSWGQCEAQLGAASATAESALFAQAAVQGQSVVAAAGDSGAEDCDTGGRQSSTRPAVDDPAGQPGVLGVGGTTLASTTTPPVESVWNGNGLGTPLDTSAPGAGGGGISALWGMGADQRDAPARLRVRRSAAVGSACGQSSGSCRAVPDVAADADPTTGYEIYWNGADTVPEPSGWQALGGTSGAAPLWAALLALADGSPACHGSPLGFVGPALYRAAASHYAADFHDVRRGNNDFTATNHGDWTAGPFYDLATGLGTPDASALVATLCADSVRIGSLAGQSSATRAAIALRLRATDVRGARLSFSASHLPPGVRLDPATGRLSGRPAKPGRYRVRTAVSDGQGAGAAGTFTWGIGGAPEIDRAALTGRGAGRRLALSVAAGRRAPGIRRLTIRLGAGADLRSARGISVSGSGPPAVRVSRGVVSISLPAPASSVDVTLPARGLTGAASGARATPTVRVAVQSGSTGTSSLRARLGGGR